MNEGSKLIVKNGPFCTMKGTPDCAQGVSS